MFPINENITQLLRLKYFFPPYPRHQRFLHPPENILLSFPTTPPKKHRHISPTQGIKPALNFLPRDTSSAPSPIK